MADTPVARIAWRRSARLIPSRYPPVGLFDRVAAPADLDAIIELEAWTNDRVNAEFGVLSMVPREEWATGTPHASVVMAAFCHPAPGGARFSGEDRGAWYGSKTIETALAESVYHRTKELLEVGCLDARVQMRLYHATFRASFHDVRHVVPSDPIYDPGDYTVSQRFARELLASGSNGIVYRSVRHAGGECVACFRPRLVRDVVVAAHYEYRWEGRAAPAVVRLSADEARPR